MQWLANWENKAETAYCESATVPRRGREKKDRNTDTGNRKEVRAFIISAEVTVTLMCRKTQDGFHSCEHVSVSFHFVPSWWWTVCCSFNCERQKCVVSAAQPFFPSQLVLMPRTGLTHPAGITKPRTAPRDGSGCHFIKTVFRQHKCELHHPKNECSLDDGNKRSIISPEARRNSSITLIMLTYEVMYLMGEVGHSVWQQTTNSLMPSAINQWVINPKFNNKVQNMVHDSATSNRTVAEEPAK